MWALRTAWLSAAYVLGWAGVARRHVESAVFILAALLAPVLLRRAYQPRRPLEVSPRRVSSAVAAGLLVAAALALYWPALGTGLLSDDFVLLRRAAGGILLDPEWEMARPVPLAIWGLLDVTLPPDAVPPTLHLINVLLHGVNAFLVFLWGRQLTSSDRTALLAASIFVTFPGSVEAVAWASGVFDVMLTTAALAICLVAARERVTAAGRLVAMSLTVVALGTKEVAIAIPVLVAASTFILAGMRRVDGYRVALWCALPVAVYVGARLAADLDPSIFPPLTGYAFKELFTRPFAALAMPFHEQAVASMPGAIAASVATTVVLIAWTAASALRASSHDAAVVTGACVWTLAAAAPLFTLFYVGPDLQGARYIYLAAAGWAILLAFCAASAVSALRTVVPRPAGAPAVIVIGAAWLLLSGVAVRSHLAPWTSAARVRDEVIASIAARAGQCADVSVIGLPDHVDGAYVFRNGFSEALARAGVRARVDVTPVREAECRIDLAARDL